MLSSYFSNIRTMRLDHSSPVHPVSESRGGSMSVTKGGGARTSLGLKWDVLNQNRNNNWREKNLNYRQ